MGYRSRPSRACIAWDREAGSKAPSAASAGADAGGDESGRRAEAEADSRFGATYVRGFSLMAPPPTASTLAPRPPPESVSESGAGIISSDAATVLNALLLREEDATVRLSSPPPPRRLERDWLRRFLGSSAVELTRPGATWTSTRTERGARRRLGPIGFWVEEHWYQARSRACRLGSTAGCGLRSFQINCRVVCFS